MQVIASPQPGPQSAFVQCPIFEIFYGGARGGGKTMSVLLKWAVHSFEDEGARGLIVRRERTHLVDMIKDAIKLFLPLGAKWRDQAKEMLMPNGAVLTFAYLESDKDAEAYQGWNLSFVGIEEITQFPDPAPLNKLRATLRIGKRRHFVATGNPGGPGHLWVKARYIDPAPLGYKILEEEFTNPWTGEKTTQKRVFIPSKIRDNKYTNNAQYIATIQQSGSPQLVRAWLEGDWNIIEGSYFPEFGAQHIIQPFEIPKHWTKYRALDWGSFRPFCCLWFAVSDGEHLLYPRGALIVYREWYGSTGKPNEGLKLDADEVAVGIKEREIETITFSVADPSIFKVDGGPSIGEKMALQGVHFYAADNSRITGWNEVRRRLKGDEGYPSVFIFSTCTNIIRTLPILQHDEHKPEDTDTDGEDHAPDTFRYGIMARYGVKDKPEYQAGSYMAVNLPRVKRTKERRI